MQKVIMSDSQFLDIIRQSVILVKASHQDMSETDCALLAELSGRMYKAVFSLPYLEPETRWDEKEDERRQKARQRGMKYISSIKETLLRNRGAANIPAAGRK